MTRILCGLLVLTLASAGLAGAAEEGCALTRLAELPVTMAGTRPLITGTINGKPARFLADSGAFYSLLTQEAAARFGLRLRPSNVTVRGTSGSERMQLTQVAEFALTGFLSGYTFEKADFLVGGSRIETSIDGIIGQNVLGRGDVEYDLANGFIRVFQSKNCKGANLAYWAGEKTVGELSFKPRTPIEPQFITDARINGKKIRVTLDTGAARSIVTTRAAARAGIEPEDDGVSAGGVSRGIGKGNTENSIALFETLDIGGEVIKNARLRIGRISISDSTDMLLGADFFLSHRIYVASRANRIYFTYNGGAVFDLSPESGADAPQQASAQSEARTADAEPSAVSPAASETDAAVPVADLAATPVPDVAGPQASASDPAPQSDAPALDAASLRRRGAASAGRLSFSAALADFDRAVAIDPTDAETYYQRGLVYAQTNRAQLAVADFDQVLKLRPEDVPARMARGGARLLLGNEEGASEDFDAAQRLAPDNSQLPLDAARAFATAGKVQRATALLDAWVARYPKDGRLLDVLLGRCRVRALGNVELELALADCDRVLKRGRTSVAYNARGLVHLRLGNYDKAFDDYNAALKRQPKDASSLYGRGLAELRQGQEVDGLKDLADAVAIDPKVASQYTRMGLDLSR